MPGDEMTVPQLARALSVKAWWKILGSVVVVLIGATTLGAWVQSIRDDKASATDRATITDLNNKLTEANSKVTEVNSKVTEMIAMVKNADLHEKAVKAKAQFLDLFLAYTNAPGDASRSIFSGYVCALWKNAQEHHVHVDATPILLSEESIRGGLSPGLKALLQSQGVSEDFFERAEHGDVTVQQEAVATIQKYAQSTHLVKDVRFVDNSTYRVPDEIALAVHTDPQCRPH
jgi:hypothetical protein